MFELVRIEEIGEVPLRKGFGVLHPLAFASFEQGNLEKARSHKYIKREPYTTATGKKRYRYWYKMPQRTALVSQSSLKVGSAFKHGSGDEAGHFHITAVNGDKVTVRHDETGKEIVTNLATLKALLDSQAQPQTQQPPSAPSPISEASPTSKPSKAASKPPKSATSLSPASSSESFPVERATVESVLQQSPQEIVQDLNIYERYKQRDAIKDIEEKIKPFLGAKRISELKEQIFLKEDSFKECLDSLYFVSNGDAKISKTYISSNESAGIFVLQGNLSNTKTNKHYSRAEGFFQRTITFEEKSIDIHNDYLRVPSELRGNSLSMQIYQRQEDFFRLLTSNLPREEKRNTAITIHAALDVGKYFWMSQGFQYKNKRTREDHIHSMYSALLFLSSKMSDPTNTLTGSKTSVQNLLDAGLKEEQIKNLAQRLKDMLKKTPPVEPWELLELDQDLPRFIYKKWDQEQGKHIDLDCGLIKYAALNGMSWFGTKYLHPETKSGKKAKAGHQYAERKRAEDAEKAAAKGKPWTWLNLPKQG